jgi:hypothetical protein
MNKIFVWEFCPECEAKTINEMVHDKSDDSYYFLCDKGHDWECIKLLFAIMQHLGIHSTSPIMGCWCKQEIVKIEAGSKDNANNECK